MLSLDRHPGTFHTSHTHNNQPFIILFSLAICICISVPFLEKSALIVSKKLKRKARARASSCATKSKMYLAIDSPQ